MAKKKNYVTRDDDGTIAMWSDCITIPAKDDDGEWDVACDEVLVFSRGFYKTFIGNLPKKGTCREFKRGDK